VIKDVASRLNLPIEPQLITITTLEDALSHRHIGGPTVQINGLDIEPEARTSTRFGLA
jgi:hypothetical protein